MFSSEGEDACTSGRIYVAVVQSVMLYGSEMWVMTTHTVGGWFRLSMLEALLKELDTYIYHHNNTGVQFITTRPIMYLCLSAERHLGSRVSKFWW